MPEIGTPLNVAYAKLIAKAWSDPAFKAKLLADPRAALFEAGIMVPAGMTFKVVENTENLTHLVLPATPAGQLSEEDLQMAAGGVVTGYCTATQPCPSCGTCFRS